jgi:hypothetical protein
MTPMEFVGSAVVAVLGVAGVLDPGHSRVLQPAINKDKSRQKRRENEERLDHPTTTAAMTENYNRDEWLHQSFS